MQKEEKNVQSNKHFAANTRTPDTNVNYIRRFTNLHQTKARGRCLPSSPSSQLRPGVGGKKCDNTRDTMSTTYEQYKIIPSGMKFRSFFESALVRSAFFFSFLCMRMHGRVRSPRSNKVFELELRKGIEFEQSYHETQVGWATHEYFRDKHACIQ